MNAIVLIISWRPCIAVHIRCARRVRCRCDTSTRSHGVSATLSHRSGDELGDWLFLLSKVLVRCACPNPTFCNHLSHIWSSQNVWMVWCHSVDDINSLHLGIHRYSQTWSSDTDTNTNTNLKMIWSWKRTQTQTQHEELVTIDPVKKHDDWKYVTEACKLMMNFCLRGPKIVTKLGGEREREPPWHHPCKRSMYGV